MFSVTPTTKGAQTSQRAAGRDLACGHAPGQARGAGQEQTLGAMINEVALSNLWVVRGRLLAATACQQRLRTKLPAIRQAGSGSASA